MAETWVLNERLNLTGNTDYIASFTCNGTVYEGIHTTTSVVVYLFNTTQMGSGQRVYTRYGWNNMAYRTIVFDESPSGRLLTWLQKNGTKQSGSEPDTPTPSGHICLIDGTRYSILRGKTLISGTGYDIKNGKVLVDGTVYDIPFTPKAYVVTVTLSSYTNVIYNGTLYDYDTVLYVTPGDSLRCVVSAALRYGKKYVAVRVNGTKVETSSFAGPPPHNLPQYSYYYDFTPESDATITGTRVDNGNNMHGEIDITT